LIDAAAEASTPLLVPDTGLNAVLTTHSHYDHWAALAQVVKATGATTYAGEFDADDISVATDIRLSDGDQVPLATPG
jgi:glyoxylase-like metal-dependent hydrolase (beta-lactamase superfamily II)